MDVALAAGARVGRAAMADERGQLREAREWRFEAPCRRAGDERAQRGDEIIGGPIAGDECFAGTELAAQEHTQEHAVVVDRGVGGVGAAARAQLIALARWQREIEPRAAPRRAQALQRGPAQQVAGRRDEPRQRNDEWVSDLSQVRARYRGIAMLGSTSRRADRSMIGARPQERNAGETQLDRLPVDEADHLR